MVRLSISFGGRGSLRIANSFKHGKESTMKFALAVSIALLTLAPVGAFAQDSSTNARGDGRKAVGPASENGDTSTGNTIRPDAMGRSAAEKRSPAGAARDGAPSSVTGEPNR
jgi:hypothetical protein